MSPDYIQNLGKFYKKNPCFVTHLIQAEIIDNQNIVSIFQEPLSILIRTSFPKFCVKFQVRPNSLFAVEPAQGVIPPEDAIQLKVTAVVDDTVKWVEKV